MSLCFWAVTMLPIANNKRKGQGCLFWCSVHMLLCIQSFYVDIGRELKETHRSFSTKWEITERKSREYIKKHRTKLYYQQNTVLLCPDHREVKQTSLFFSSRRCFDHDQQLMLYNAQRYSWAWNSWRNQGRHQDCLATSLQEIPIA